MTDREEFIDYIKNVVNPMRIEQGLSPIESQDEISMCFDILESFYESWVKGRAEGVAKWTN